MSQARVSIGLPSRTAGAGPDEAIGSVLTPCHDDAELTRAVFGRFARRRRQGRAIRMILPDYLGGVTSYTLDLTTLAAFQRHGVRLLWLMGDTSGQAPSGIEAAAWLSNRIRHTWPAENLFSVLRRMNRVLRRDRGALVANEFFGLAYAARHERSSPVIQILHGDIPMYYRLAEQFEPYVDAFVAVSARVAEKASRRLPHRAADIHHLPSGVPVPERLRAPEPGPLRLVYTGRISRKKGVLDLPEIDRCLRAEGVSVVWTVIGSGPDEEALRCGFDANARVTFTGGLTPEKCRSRLPDHDLFVLPSHGEGLPLSLLEAMAAGVVPVVSDLESGISEVVDDGVTGLLARPGHPEEFAGAILRLHRQRSLLEDCSRAAAARVRARHALEDRGEALLGLLCDLEALPTRDKPAWRRGPSQLDRPWLPNPLVRSVRRLARCIGGNDALRCSR